MALASDDRRAASLLARIERIQVSPWHIRALLVMGSATFFDAFDVLAIIRPSHADRSLETRATHDWRADFIELHRPDCGSAFFWCCVAGRRRVRRHVRRFPGIATGEILPVDAELGRSPPARQHASRRRAGNASPAKPARWVPVTRQQASLREGLRHKPAVLISIAPRAPARARKRIAAKCDRSMYI